MGVGSGIARGACALGRNSTLFAVILNVFLADIYTKVCLKMCIF